MLLYPEHKDREKTEGMEELPDTMGRNLPRVPALKSRPRAIKEQGHHPDAGGWSVGHSKDHYRHAFLCKIKVKVEATQLLQATCSFSPCSWHRREWVTSSVSILPLAPNPKAVRPGQYLGHLHPT